MRSKLFKAALMIMALFAALTVTAGAESITLDENISLDETIIVIGYNDDEDYMQEIVQALEDGSEHAVYAARIYEAQRNLKIQSLGLDVSTTDFFTGGKTVQEILEEVYDYIGASDSGYELTDAERAVVESAVMAEAGGESFEGQMMIAQCILDGAKRKGVDVITFIEQSQIVTSEKEPYESCRKAVAQVFDMGKRVTEEVADIWYAPAITYSEWHESQIYVTTIGAHKFFRKISV